MPVRSWLRLAVFVLGLLVAAGVGFGAGRVAGPLGARAAATDHTNASAPAADTSVAAVEGLATSVSGYTLVAEQTAVPVGQATPLRFRIQGPAGRPVMRYDTVDDRLIQALVVRRDLTGLQDLTPALQPDSTWTTPLTLVVDLNAAGTYTPQPLTPAEPQSTVDGYAVTLAGTPGAGRPEPLLASIRKDGQPVTDIDAPARLVALREGDLAYLGSHADPGPDPATPRFWLTAPGPARYRVYLLFATAGTPHTAVFTRTAP